jgi:hypothetical protein
MKTEGIILIIWTSLGLIMNTIDYVDGYIEGSTFIFVLLYTGWLISWMVRKLSK